MAFLLERTNPNFSVSRVHGVLRLETQNGHFVAVVNSYATPEAYDANLLNWQDSYQLPLQADPTVAANPQAYLIGPEGPFAGATVLEEATPLERLQSVKWAEIKGERDRRETAGFPYLGKVIDSDSRSVQRIALAVQAAGVLPLTDSMIPFSIDWTCQDNTVLTLNGMQTAEMAVALADHANALHVIARGLREQIYAEDATPASVAGVAWPLTEVVA